MVQGWVIQVHATAREHHWDVLRALLMLLGIPYHVAMSYRADAVWIVNSGEGAPVLNHLAQLIHVFRMPAFFLIAGYFAALLLARRSPGEWLRGRFSRLTVPFLATLLTLNPLLNLFCELSNFGLEEAIASWKYNSARSGGYWIRHLWFIIVLLYLSAAAALFAHFSPRLRTANLAVRLDNALSCHIAVTAIVTGVLIGIWQGAAIEYFYIAGLATNLPQQILRIDQLIEFAPWFALGFLISRAPALKQAVYRFSPALLLFGIAALALDLAFRDQLWPPYGRFLDTLAAIGITQPLVALARNAADRPSAIVRRLVDASFVIYLFHMPIVAGLVVAGKGVAVPLALKVPLVMLMTLALSWACWLVIERSSALRLLFDGTRPKPSAVPGIPQPAST